MASTDTSSSDLQLFTLADAAKFGKVSTDFLRKHIRKIPHTRLGNRIRFSQANLRDWIEQNARNSQ
jgi:excisionase family DNA binding protein